MTPGWVSLALPLAQHVAAQLSGPEDVPPDLVTAVLECVSAPAPTTFHFAAQRRQIGKTTVMFTTQSAFHFRGIPRWDQGSVHIGFVLTNRVAARVDGQAVAPLCPGSAFVVTNWDAVEVDSLQPTRGLHIRLPKSRLLERGVHFRSRAFSAATSTSLVRPLRAFASALVDGTWDPSGIGAITAERSIEDLVAGLFLETQGYGLDGEELRLGLRCRALTHIAAAHRDPELTPRGIAAQLSVSLRHLQRAFEGTGASITSEISKSRAHTASLLLSASGPNALTTAEIARRSGFTSTFELRRAVKATYGVLPSEYRSLAHLAAASAADKPA